VHERTKEGFLIAMTFARRALVPVAAFAGLLLHAVPALAMLAPSPASPWATANGRVLTIARVNGVVYVGGKFTQMTDPSGAVLARNHLAAISAADGHVLPWNPGANNFVRAIAVSTDGTKIYIGGDFTTLGGAARTRLAAEAAIAPASTRTTGTLLAWKPSADEGVYTITQLGGRVYLGGAFLHVSGRGRPRLAAVAASNGALAGWDPKADGAVRALLPSPTGSVVFAGGSFTHVNGASTPYLAAIDPASGLLHRWKSHTGDSILSLAENGSYLYAGDKGGGGHVRSWVLATGKLRWTESTDGNVNAVALLGQGSAQQLVIGGHFTKVGAQARHKVAVISPQTGLVDTSPGSWHPAAAGSDLGIYGELAYGQKVYFGGDFLEWQTHPGVAEQPHLAVFSTTAPADTTPPVMKAPAAIVRNGATLGMSKVPLSLSWSASDPGSGVCRYRAERRYGTNPYTPIGLLLATSRGASTAVSPAAHAYTFEAAATDCSDNTSAFVSGAPVTLTAYQNSSASISYRGGWRGARAAKAFGGSVRVSGVTGASATLRFTGREVAWVASLAPGDGSARVLIDGRAAGIVHLRSSAGIHRRVVFTRSWATSGAHTIRIIALGTHGHPMISLDALLALR
jgi:trimeric autotransporter adhesin